MSVGEEIPSSGASRVVDVPGDRIVASPEECTLLPTEVLPSDRKSSIAPVVAPSSNESREFAYAAPMLAGRFRPGTFSSCDEAESSSSATTSISSSDDEQEIVSYADFDGSIFFSNADWPYDDDDGFALSGTALPVRHVSEDTFPSTALSYNTGEGSSSSGLTCSLDRPSSSSGCRDNFFRSRVFSSDGGGLFRSLDLLACEKSALRVFPADGAGLS